MKKQLAAAIFGLVGFIAFSGESAFADLSRIGPTSTVVASDLAAVGRWNSWYRLDLTSIVPPVGGFNSFTMTLKDPATVPQLPTRPTTVDTFDTTGGVIQGFAGAAGWSMGANTSTSVTASGTATSVLDVRLYWTGSVVNGAAFDIVFRNANGVIASGFLYTKDGSPTYTDSQLQSVPLPAAAWMGLAMLGGLGLVSLARRKREQILS